MSTGKIQINPNLLQKNKISIINPDEISEAPKSFQPDQRDIRVVRQNIPIMNPENGIEVTNAQRSRNAISHLQKPSENMKSQPENKDSQDNSKNEKKEESENQEEKDNIFMGFFSNRYTVILIVVSIIIIMIAIYVYKTQKKKKPEDSGDQNLIEDNTEGGKEGGKEASKEGNKEVSKEVNKELSKEVNKEVNKEASKEVNKEVSKEEITHKYTQKPNESPKQNHSSILNSVSKDDLEKLLKDNPKKNKKVSILDDDVNDIIAEKRAENINSEDAINKITEMNNEINNYSNEINNYSTDESNSENINYINENTDENNNHNNENEKDYELTNKKFNVNEESNDDDVKSMLDLEDMDVKPTEEPSSSTPYLDEVMNTTCQVPRKVGKKIHPCGNKVVRDGKCKKHL